MAKTQAMFLVPKSLRGDLTAEELRRLKRRLVAANRAMGYWLQQTGGDCAGMTTGHVSARVPGTNTFITKGRAPERDLMSEVSLQKLVQIEISTREKVAGEMEIATMGEIEIHACVYEARPDVLAVCHGHGEYTRLCGTFGLKLKAITTEGLSFVLKGYGLYDKPYAIASPETGIPMARALDKYSAVLLAGHGAVTVSDKGPEEAIMNLIRLENLCKANWKAFSAVGRDYEKYAFGDDVLKEHQRISGQMRGRYNIPGKDMVKDQCYYNAGMVRTLREAVEG